MTDALRALVAQLRDEQTPISDYVIEPSRPAEDPLFVELVREGYLLHYEEPRLLAGHDADLALLAGDYLYALGIERLAASGDIEEILVLADLISDCAQLHAEGREDEVPELWRRALASLGERA